jgi:glycosyltransferase involved in cell wall biosynthesis
MFVQTSWAEGVPKVVQEAAACGLPIVLFGFYEAPSVQHDVNGYVAWSDEELTRDVGALLDDPGRRQQMGAESARLARAWNWDAVAPEWEAKILEVVDRHAAR